jgi:hypothetical protein
MSNFLDTADVIKTRLLTAPAGAELPTPIDLTGLTVLVDRQKNILSDVAKAVGKVRGTAIVILWEGWTTLDRHTSRPRLGSQYNLTVWSKPVIAGDDLPADEVMASVIRRLWHWVPGGGHAHGECELRGGSLMPNKSYLVYDCEVVVPIDL